MRLDRARLSSTSAPTIARSRRAVGRPLSSSPAAVVHRAHRRIGTATLLVVLAPVLVAAVNVRSSVFVAGGHSSAARCRVTVASGATRPPKPIPPSFNYGNAMIAVALNPVDGRLVAGRLPSGGERATINRDGSIYAKYGWWRAGSTKPVITGRLVDDPKRRLRADVPGGYGNGFQATGLTFPTIGCWRVTGRFGRARLAFTVLVSKSPLGP
jgi:hypothetical protein